MSDSAKSLSHQQALVLNAAFKLALGEDLRDLHRLAVLTLGKVEAPSITPTWLAPFVAAKLGLATRGVKHRLYGNSISRRLHERTQFMHAVQVALEEQFETFGGSIGRDYSLYISPVDTEAGHGAEGELDRLDPYGEFKDWARVRVGAWLADGDEPSHVDNTHHYTEIFRQDMLDYPTGDFYSIRRLQGRNVSHSPSRGVTYRESSERRFSLEDAGISAYATKTRQRLRVDGELGPKRKAHTHAFTIWFEEPVAPGGTFDVVYAIRLPGELIDLSRDEEVMSISLARVAKGVDKLIFNVALNFRPTAVGAFTLTRNKKFLPCEGAAPSISAYRTKHWFESDAYLGIGWTDDSAAPHIIRWSTPKPQGRMYIICFRSDDGGALATTQARLTGGSVR